MTDTTPARAERALALRYVSVTMYEGISALFALDDTLGGIIRSTREPIVGQMRLTWWFHALTALDTAPPPAEPVLRALHAEVLPRGVAGATLATMTDGWAVLIGEEALDGEALTIFARMRGASLFSAAAGLLGIDDPRIAAAGEGWALADLAGRTTNVGVAAEARRIALARLDPALTGRWPRAVRSLGALAILARSDLAVPPLPPGHPRRVARMLLHRLTGF